MRQFPRLALAFVLGLTAVFAGGAPAYAAGGTVSALHLWGDPVLSGIPVDMTVSLDAPVAEPTLVALQSGDPSTLTVPATITVPAGGFGLNFRGQTVMFRGAPRTVCVTASAGGGTATGCITVDPRPDGPVVTAVTFSPASVPGGSPATGTVSFDLVTDGAVVSLTSSDPTVATVPATTVVSGGRSTGAFPVTTAAVTTSTAVTVTASAFGVSTTGTLTVTPAAGPPTTDTVRVTQASWRKRELRIAVTRATVPVT